MSDYMTRLRALPTEELRKKKDALKPSADFHKQRYAAGQEVSKNETLAAAIYEAILRELRRRQQDPETGLLEFIRYFWRVLEPVDPFVEGWAVECICAHLQAITQRKTVEINGITRPFNRLLANVCPGFMKSMCVNIWWPAHEWGPMEMPHLRYVAFSYNSELTERDNAKFRDLVCSADYKELWGHVFSVIGDPKAGKIVLSNDKTGFKRATSIGGTGTGERGHRVLCLPGSEKILTDKGWLPIGAVVDQRLDVKIAGLDHATGQIEWQAIEAYERNPGNEIVEVACEEGALRCTGDHPVFVQGHGYARADSLQAGDELVWSGRDLPLPALQRRDTTQTKSAPQILQQAVSDRRRESTFAGYQQPPMRSLRYDGLPAARASQANAGATVLQSHMPRQVEPWGEQSSLHRLAQHCLRLLQGTISAGKQQQVLLAQMCNGADTSGNTGALASQSGMRAVLNAFRSGYQDAALLHAPLRRHGARPSDTGFAQWALRAWSGTSQVSARLDANAQGADQRARWQLLPALWSWSRPKAGTGRAPHQLRQGRFAPAEPHHALPVLPRQDARQPEVARTLETRTVQSVKAVGWEDVVYNVRVGPCHNYFASGIVVHNCDDPHRIKGQHESDEARQSTTQWVREAMQNRLNDLERDAIVIIMQRLHEADSSGVILEHLGDEYCHLVIPMAYETNRHFSHYRGWNDGNDPRTQDGELAWPERYPIQTMRSYMRNAYLWAGQYQQNPSPRGGGIFKEDWWQPFEVAQDGSFGLPVKPEFILASLDTAFKEKEENDYSALTVWAVYDEPKTKQRRLLLIDGWRKKLPMHGIRTFRQEGEDERAYMRRAAKEWGLCEWVSYTCTRREIDCLIIEDSARGHDVNNELRRVFGDRNWGVQLMPVKGDKWANAHAVVDLFTDDMIFAPGMWNGDMWEWREWAADVINEMITFPRGAHDDFVDSVTMALRFLRKQNLAIRRDEKTIAEQQMAAWKPKANPKSLYPV